MDDKLLTPTQYSHKYKITRDMLYQEYRKKKMGDPNRRVNAENIIIIPISKIMFRDVPPNK